MQTFQWFNISLLFIMKKDILAVVLLFVAIIALALLFSASSSYVPYTSLALSGPARYEGFHGYSSASNNQVVDGPVESNLINKSQSNCKKISGFSGLGVFCNPITPTEVLDIYSQAEGKIDAQGYGYYNSKGSLVMDETMKKQLRTRGMNSTGVSSVVAGSAV